MQDEKIIKAEDHAKRVVVTVGDKRLAVRRLTRDVMKEIFTLDTLLKKIDEEKDPMAALELVYKQLRIFLGPAPEIEELSYSEATGISRDITAALFPGRKPPGEVLAPEIAVGKNLTGPGDSKRPA